MTFNNLITETGLYSVLFSDASFAADADDFDGDEDAEADEEDVTEDDEGGEDDEEDSEDTASDAEGEEGESDDQSPYGDMSGGAGGGGGGATDQGTYSFPSNEWNKLKLPSMQDVVDPKTGPTRNDISGLREVRS